MKEELSGHHFDWWWHHHCCDHLLREKSLLSWTSSENVEKPKNTVQQKIEHLIHQETSITIQVSTEMRRCHLDGLGVSECWTGAGCHRCRHDSVRRPEVTAMARPCCSEMDCGGAVTNMNLTWFNDQNIRREFTLLEPQVNRSWRWPPGADLQPAVCTWSCWMFQCVHLLKPLF